MVGDRLRGGYRRRASGRMAAEASDRVEVKGPRSAETHPVVEREPPVLPPFTPHADVLNFMKGKGREDDCAIVFRPDSETLGALPEDQRTTSELLRNPIDIIDQGNK
jgi:hypothetical protein